MLSSVLRNKQACFQDLLSKELSRIIQENEVDKEIRTLYGNKYLVKGNIGAMFKKVIPIVTVWIIEKEDSVPRFVTAYPSNEAVR